MTLIECLRGGRQCDEDGTEIIMSRQACLEAADEIIELRHFIRRWVHDSKLQTYESREKFRAEGKSLLGV